MNEAIELKMSEWISKEDDVSMFKFASVLFITAPKDKEHELGIQEVLDHAELLAERMNDIELAKAKKEIKQLLNEGTNNE